MSDGEYILVIEDEFLIALELTASLEAQGYQVAAVPTGSAALGAAAERHPDLVLVDIKLRGNLDGIETARTIHDLHDVPIIFVTVFDDADTMARAQAAAPAGYVVKPFDSRRLASAVEAALA